MGTAPLRVTATLTDPGPVKLLSKKSYTEKNPLAVIDAPAAAAVVCHGEKVLSCPPLSPNALQRLLLEELNVPGSPLSMPTPLTLKPDDSVVLGTRIAK